MVEDISRESIVAHMLMDAIRADCMVDPKDIFKEIDAVADDRDVSKVVRDNINLIAMLQSLTQNTFSSVGVESMGMVLSNIGFGITLTADAPKVESMDPLDVFDIAKKFIEDSTKNSVRVDVFDKKNPMIMAICSKISTIGDKHDKGGDWLQYMGITYGIHLGLDYKREHAKDETS